MDTLSQGQPRVLIVDDQKNWREALCDMLEPQYEIETAASYDEAKRKLEQRAFHVLVADQRLVDAEKANIQGILLLDKVSELQDGTRAIIVTGYPTIEAAKKALRGRNAYDYILKYPEESGPFNIRLYRERVKEAAEEARLARQKAITLDFSVSNLVTNLTYDRIAETLFPEDTVARDVLEGIRKILNRLLCPFQPLARQMGRVWPAGSGHICEILCWSRNHSKAILIRLGKDQSTLDARKVKWLGQTWHLTKNEQFASAPLLGISYTVDGMSFDDFASLAEED